MKNDQNPKYPASLFVIGFFMNLTKNFILFLPSLIFLFIGIWVKWCLIAGLLLLLVDVILSLIEQMQIYNATLNSDNPNFMEWQTAILSSDWKGNVKDLVESKLGNTDEEKPE